MAKCCAARGFSYDLHIDKPGKEPNNFVHHTNELVTIIDGQLSLLINGESFVLGVGDELLIPARVAHSVKNQCLANTFWLFGYGGL